MPAHFSHFWGNLLPKNLVMSRTRSCRFLIPSQNLEKTNYLIPRKHLDERSDVQTHFLGLFRLPLFLFRAKMEINFRFLIIFCNIENILTNSDF